MPNPSVPSRDRPPAPPSRPAAAPAPAPQTGTDKALDAERCYTALLARDARFDGRWFVGVTSTGVYCRPVCRVRTPKRANCRFFASAALAEAARFRPCLKCRPEIAPRPDAHAGAGGESPDGLAPRWTVMDASRTLARQAAAWLDGCDAATSSIEQLAGELGITSRHLRRIFTAEHGVSPLQYLQTRRLLLAKQLLTDTAMPITELAHAAGFASLRRFNAAFLAHYRLQPGALRRLGAPAGARSPWPGPTLRLAYRPPYAVDALLAFLAPRAVSGVERVDPGTGTLARTLSLTQGGRRLSGWLCLGFDRERDQALVTLSPSLWPACARLLPLLRRWLDLDAAPERIDAGLGALASDEPGLRLPGTLDRFELAVRAVLGQQVTVAAARTLAGRLAERFGQALPEPAPEGMPGLLFPTPEALAEAEPAAVAELGIIRRRAETLIALGRAWPTLAYAQGRGSVEAALAELLELPGIGPWTAQYMLMRGWSWPDAFPPRDVVLERALLPQPAPQAGAPALKPAARSAAALAAAERYRPYRSYAVMRLWRRAALPTETHA